MNDSTVHPFFSLSVASERAHTRERDRESASERESSRERPRRRETERAGARAEGARGKIDRRRAAAWSKAGTRVATRSANRSGTSTIITVIVVIITTHTALTLSHRVFTWLSVSCLQSFNCSIHWSSSLRDAFSSIVGFCATTILNALWSSSLSRWSLTAGGRLSQLSSACKRTGDSETAGCCCSLVLLLLLLRSAGRALDDHSTHTAAALWCVKRPVCRCRRRLSTRSSARWAAAALPWHLPGVVDVIARCSAAQLSLSLTLTLSICLTRALL